MSTMAFVLASAITLNTPKTEPLIPKWGFGFMQSQWGYDIGTGPFGFDTQEGFINHARALRGLDNPYGDHLHPADIMVLDMYWCGGQTESYSCWDWPNNMRWDYEKFPDPEAMFATLEELNFKVFLNYHHGGFESHREEWLESMQQHLGWGATAPWLDFWTAGSEAETVIWNQLQAHHGEDKRIMFMARHYTLPNTENAEGGSFDEAGIFMEGIGIETPPNEDPSEKSMPVHWTGDVVGSWLGLQQTIEGIVYSTDGAMGGWSYLHSDTPGHSRVVGEDDAELAVRWIQFSDFTTGTRNHGYTPRWVWSWGNEAEQYSRDSRTLRYRLLPYIYTYARIIYDEAIPLTRPMLLAYPGQADENRHQFMFGEELLVAPVTNSAKDLDNRFNVFLPAEDEWIDYWSHDVYAGGQTIPVDVSLENLGKVPLFVKRGAIIPMGPEIYHIDPSRHPDPLTLDIYPGTSVSTFNFYDDDGESMGYQRGEYATTLIEVEPSEHRTLLRVNPSVGDYSGKPLTRDYIAKINLFEAEPSRVTINGNVLLHAERGSIDSPTNGNNWHFDKTLKQLWIRFGGDTSGAYEVLVEHAQLNNE